MDSVCTVPARGGRSCERFGVNKTINRIPFYFQHLANRSCCVLCYIYCMVVRIIFCNCGSMHEGDVLFVFSILLTGPITVSSV